MRDPVSDEDVGPVRALAGWVLRVVGLATFSLLTVVITFDVVLRYFFNAPLRWTIEATGMLLLLLVFSSVPYVWERAAHIRMVIIYDKLGGRAKALADLVTTLAAASFSAFLAYQMFRRVPQMMAVNERAEHLDFPHWPLAAFIAVVGVIMTLQFVLFAWDSVRRLRRG